MSEYKFPEDIRYTVEHEWVRIEGDLAVVGLTDYAQSRIGDVTYVDLPEVGLEVGLMAELGVIESVKAAVEFYSPLAGTVAEVNPALENEPQLINQDCYAKGWLVKLEDFDPAGLETHLDAAAYREFTASGE